MKITHCEQVNISYKSRNKDDNILDWILNMSSLMIFIFQGFCKMPLAASRVKICVWGTGCRAGVNSCLQYC